MKCSLNFMAMTLFSTVSIMNFKILKGPWMTLTIFFRSLTRKNTITITVKVKMTMISCLYMAV